MVFFPGTAGDDSFIGTGGNDTINGLQLNDTLRGEGGDDLINAGSGDDSVDGGAGNDVIIGGFGIDTVDGGDDDDVLTFVGSGLATTLQSQGRIAKQLVSAGLTFDNAGSTQLLPAPGGSNSIEAIIGDPTQSNTIDGSNFEGLAIGGNANFNINLQTGSFVIGGFPPGLTFTIENFNNIRGAFGDDIIVGDANANSFLGSAGNDLIDGFLGENTLVYENVINSDNDIPILQDFTPQIRLGDFSTAEVIDPSSTVDNPLPNIVVDTATVVKNEYGAYGAPATNLGSDGIQGINFIAGSSGVTNTIDGSLGSLLNISFTNVDLSQDLLEVNVNGLERTYTVVNFGDVVGTFNNDLIGGSADDNTFFGSVGNDTFNGAGGNDVLDYSEPLFNPTGSTTPSPITLTAGGFVEKGTNGNSGIDKFTNIETIVASDVTEDTISGSLPVANNAALNADLTAETLIIDFVGLTGVDPISLNVEGFDNFIGTTNNDTFVGNSGDNLITGTFGDDIINGGSGGEDVVDYTSLNAAITLGSQGLIAKGVVDTDGNGSLGTDQLDGSTLPPFTNTIDTIIGNINFTNTIDGQLGVNPAEANGSFIIDLGAAEDNLIVEVSTQDVGPFTFNLQNFDDVVGTANNDIIVGNDRNNNFFGSAGDDIYDGDDGFDTLDYSDLGVGITLLTQGQIAKDAFSFGDSILGSNGTDRIDNPDTMLPFPDGNIDKIIGSTSQTNSINGVANGAFADAGNNSTFDIDLRAGSFILSLDGASDVTFEIENFNDVVGTTNNDIIRGTDTDDTLAGDIGDDTLTARGGNDVLVGGAGDDQLSANGGNDTVMGDAGADRIDGGNGDDNLDGGIDDDKIVGRGGNDSISGGVGDDTISGNGGEDTILGSSGNDIINGGGGFDTLDYTGLGESVLLQGQGQITKTNVGIDTLQGSGAVPNPLNPIVNTVEKIIGDVGANINNFIDGTVNVGGNGSFVIDLSLNALTVNVSTPGVASQVFEVVNFDNVKGTQNTDSIIGNDNANTIVGSAGNDIIDGAGGADVIDYTGLGQSIDVLDTGDILKGGSLGTDSINNVETIVADSVVTGNSINGEDNVGVSFTVDLAADTLDVAVEGGPVIQRTIVNFDDVFGTAGDDTITGDDQANILTGGNGDDTIAGGAGADTINGVGSEFGIDDFDTLTGGADADTFILGTTGNVFYEGIGFAEIVDFQTGVDGIQLAGTFDDYDFSSNASGGIDIFFTGGGVDDLVGFTNSTLFTTDLTFV